jgi:hypothetical protein
MTYYKLVIDSLSSIRTNTFKAIDNLNHSLLPIKYFKKTKKHMLASGCN